MARRGFWDSFYQGWEAGDKMGERFRTMAQRRDVANAAKADQEVSSEYSPEQVAALNELTGPKEGETWDEATQSYKDQAGNFRAVANVPEYVNGGFEAQGLGRMTPKQKYTLGSETRDTSFTPEEIREFRMNKIADVYDQYDPEKAMSLRAQADQNQLNKYGLDKAKMELDYQKDWNNWQKQASEINSTLAITQAKFQEELKSGDPITAARNYAKWYNDKVQDGNYIFIDDNGQIAMGNGNAGMSQTQLNVFNPEVQQMMLTKGREAADSFLNSSMPMKDFNQWIARKQFETSRADRKEDVNFRNDRAKVSDKQFTDKMAADREQAVWRNDIDVAQHNDRMGLQRQQLAIQQQEANDRGAYWRSGGRGSSASKAKGVGYIKDTGMPVEYDEGVGYYTRGQNGEVVPVSDLRKIVSVGRASAEPDTSIEAGLYEQFKRGLLTPQEYQAALGEIQIDRGISSAFDKLPPKEQAGGLGGAKAPWYMQGKPTVPVATPLQPANPQQILPRNARMGQ